MLITFLEKTCHLYKTIVSCAEQKSNIMRHFFPTPSGCLFFIMLAALLLLVNLRCQTIPFLSASLTFTETAGTRCHGIDCHHLPGRHPFYVIVCLSMLMVLANKILVEMKNLLDCHLLMHSFSYICKKILYGTELWNHWSL